jgi:UDP-GlcNAc:undecaprenyl-phosphate/decaprenyl-phosphate GlcNAc-1-phosphate transferase
MAMLLGFCAATAPLWFQSSLKPFLVLLAILVVWATGLGDDIGGLPPLLRLTVHISAGIVLWTQGWRLNLFASPILDLLLTAVFVAFLINAMNMFDGMDGLAASWAVFACVGFLIVADAPFSRMIAAALAGVCVGVLLNNFPPARIFMGDSGSTLIGITLALLCLDRTRTQAENHKLITPLLFIALPVADAILAILRRVIAFQSPFLGDRRHFYDLLLQRGWPVQRILTASVSITSLTVALGIFSISGANAAKWAVGLVAILFIVCAYLLGSFSTHPEIKTDRPALTSMQAVGIIGSNMDPNRG